MGTSWGHLGDMLGAFGGCESYGDILGTWEHLGASWGHLGDMVGTLGGEVNPMGTSGGHGDIWGV